MSPAPLDPVRQRRLPVGAEIVAGGVHFRVWAPRASRLDLVLAFDGAEHRIPLDREAGGHFSGSVDSARAGSLYRFSVDGGDPLPDPVSRFQPKGPHGPSMVVDPHGYRWSDASWRGVPMERAVIYELHVGTFTPEGSYAGVERQLERLGDLGITVVELLPLADFPGRFGWGYDGVDLFAPSRLYGTPDELRSLVDRAHSLGIAVILDVVYNHLGPDGNYLASYAAEYVSDRHHTEWGEALNFDGEGAPGVREFFIANASYWIDEFHIDGLRLDATHSIFDDSQRHIVAEVAAAVRAAAGGRTTLVIAENEPQHAHLVRTVDEGGFGLDGIWNDDFHHTARVAITGKSDAYYADYLGSPQEFVSAAKYAFLFQGQHYRWQGKRRGSPTFGIPPQRFVHFIENHDQVANSLDGRRMHQSASPGRFRAMTALLLLGPQTPLLFQGQEWCSERPFLFFADHQGELGAKVAAGRAEFLSQFPPIAASAVKAGLDDPRDPATVDKCRLDPESVDRDLPPYRLHRDLLRLRHHDPVISGERRRRVDGAVLGAHAFLLRMFGDDGDDRLLIVNLGITLHLDPAPEPLLAPPPAAEWRLEWSSEEVAYGGTGTPMLETLASLRTEKATREALAGGGGDSVEGAPADGARYWRLPGECAVLLVPRPPEADR
jgi:maltooligosyltrehalose trehalohydrolase